MNILAGSNAMKSNIPVVSTMIKKEKKMKMKERKKKSVKFKRKKKRKKEEKSECSKNLNEVKSMLL